MPGYVVHFLAPLGAGLDHRAWLVNGELVVRQANEPDADAIRREGAVLGMVKRVATLPVPEVAFIDPDNGTLAYRHLPGTPLLDLRVDDTREIAARLGAFLAAIHGIPLDEAKGIVELDDAPPGEWLDEARETYPSIANHLSIETRTRIEGFLASQPSLIDLTAK